MIRSTRSCKAHFFLEFAASEVERDERIVAHDRVEQLGTTRIAKRIQPQIEILFAFTHDKRVRTTFCAEERTDQQDARVADSAGEVVRAFGSDRVVA